MASSSSTLTTGSVYQHLIRLSIPAAMGMVFNTLYNLTDFWFAGLLSDDSLAGVSIAGSVFFILLAIGIGMQSGTSAVIAPEIGAGNDAGVGGWVDEAFGLSILFSGIAMMLGWLLANELVLFLGAEPHIAPLANQYLEVTLAGSAAFILSFMAAGALMAMGDTTSNRNVLMVGFFANFLLNPLFTFVLDFGVRGLALSTVVIKIASAVYLFRILALKTGRWVKPSFNFSKWLALLQQVLPASLNMLTVILGGFISVAYIGRFGSDHIAGYAVGLRIEQVLLLPALGLNAAVMAIAGQNYGAGHFDRVRETYSKGLTIGLAMAAVSIPAMVFLSPTMMGIFTQSDVIKLTGASYLRIDAIAFYAYVVLFISVALLQSIKRPLFPMVLGIARQFIIPASINYLLIVELGYPMITIFYTIVSVVVISAFVANWYTRKVLNTFPKTVWTVT
ncbi:MAG: MATE family efflux transporter [Granulosicoccaceae bacterium]